MSGKDSTQKAQWSAAKLEAQQSALFDLVLGQVVPSLKAVDAPKAKRNG